MSKITGSVVIDRPAEVVFDFVADEDNEPSYNREMVSVVKMGEAPIGVGTRWEALVVSKRRPIPVTIEFTGYERPTRLASRSTADTMEIDGVLTFSEQDGRTTMTWVWNVRPRGLLRLFSPLVTRVGRAQEERIWQGLKDRLERGPAAVG